MLNYEQLPFKPFIGTFGGTAKLFVNDKSVGKGEVKNAAAVRFSATETMESGMDLGAPDSATYREHAPFSLTGTIKDVIVEVAATQTVKKHCGREPRHAVLRESSTMAIVELLHLVSSLAHDLTHRASVRDSKAWVKATSTSGA